MIKQFFILNKKPILIFIIVFAAELTAIFALSNINGIETFLRGDGRDYENLADNLINHKMLAITPGPPYTPTSFRTPIYPFWLALIYLIFNSYNAAIFIGAFTFALSAPIVYFIGKEIFSEKISTVGAIIFGLEPWALFQSGFIAAEQIFIPTFLLSVYLFCRYLKLGLTRHLYSAAAILAVAALIRPAALLFIAIYMFLAFIFEFKHSFGQSLKKSGLIFLIFVFVLAPWLVRNKIVLNSWQFSSASGIRVFGDYIMLGKYISKTKPNELVDIYEEAKKVSGAKNDIEAITTVENSKKLTEVALKGIKSNPYSFLKMHFKNMTSFFFKNSYGNIFFDLGIKNSNIQSVIGGYLSQLKIDKAFEMATKTSSGAKILLVLTLFWPLIIFLTIIGILKLIRQNEHNLLFWFLMLWMAYFPFLVAWGDISRYKLAIHAPLFLLAAYAIFIIFGYHKHANNS